MNRNAAFAMFCGLCILISSGIGSYKNDNRVLIIIAVAAMVLVVAFYVYDNNMVRKRLTDVLITMKSSSSRIISISAKLLAGDDVTEDDHDHLWWFINTMIAQTECKEVIVRGITFTDHGYKVTISGFGKKVILPPSEW